MYDVTINRNFCLREIIQQQFIKWQAMLAHCTAGIGQSKVQFQISLP